jgi:hypothetical protein
VTTTTARTTAGSADADRWVERAGKAGLSARGIVYCVLAALCVALAVGDRTEETDQQGALAELAERSLGRVLLVVLIVGFVAYGAWRLARAVRGEGGEDPNAGKRLLDLAKAALYLGLALSTYRLLTDDAPAGGQAGGGGGGGSGTERIQGASARLMHDYGWGRWAIGLAGLGVIAFGGWQVYRGLSQKFRKRLEESFEAQHAATIKLGVVGHVARGAVIGVIGWLLIRSARNFDPTQPVGVDAALREVLHAPYGPVLAVAVGLGLGAYGLYSFGEARYRQIS